MNQATSRSLPKAADIVILGTGVMGTSIAIWPGVTSTIKS